MDDLLLDVDKLEQVVALPATDLHGLSDKLLDTFHNAIKNDKSSFLPSYITKLPSGTETGRALAIDLGGSTLRVALFGLGSEKGPSHESKKNGWNVVTRRLWLVDDKIKTSSASNFFSWIAARVAEVVQPLKSSNTEPLPLGVAWSFPIIQTSVSSGLVQKMGKGYEVWRELNNTDLKSHFESAFEELGLRINMAALLNDTEATLMAHAFENPATRLSLIWGTGLNAAIYMPVDQIGEEKLEGRPRKWHEQAESVLINTELSFFGGNHVLPIVIADHALDLESTHPGFQPLEQMTSGRYLGEIVRRVMNQEISWNRLFGGTMPDNFDRKFSFGTDLVGRIESYPYPENMRELISIYHMWTLPSEEDAVKVVRICNAVTKRAALYVAIAVFSLYRLREQSQRQSAKQTGSSETAVAYCGGAVENHPVMRQQCQDYLDLLMKTSKEKFDSTRLVLEHADDSGLLGAAVAAILNKDEEKILAKL